MGKNKTIILIAILSLTLLGEKIFSQVIVTGTVTGTCIDGKLEGAIVKVKGKDIKVKTKKGGSFSITCRSSKDTLVFSFCGYKSYEQRIGKQRIMNVKLVDDTIPIDGVLKIGYSINSKKDVTAKPVIYLYPIKEMNVSIKLEYSGVLQTTYPKYNNGWKVKAFPNGDIINLADNKEYSYLFWDGLTDYSDNQLTYDSGFVIAGDSALQFLQNILPTMGLKPKEYNEFIVYWLPFLQTNRLNFIHFRTGEDYDIISKNEVSPKPDSQIRIFIEFKAIDTVFKVNPQLFKRISRQGFTIVEWGGSLLTKPIKVRNEKGDYITR